ncbi:hypothetical protein Tco_1346821 [Tanacetum coccineum]
MDCTSIQQGEWLVNTTNITTNTLSNIKLPVLQKDDYDTWAMEMEHYLEYIDNEVWKVIQNGNSKKRVTKGKDGVYRILPPTTQAEQVADEKERKFLEHYCNAVPKMIISDEKFENGYDSFKNSYPVGCPCASVSVMKIANHKFLRSLLPDGKQFSYDNEIEEEY